jgi:hypothetical protein
LRRGGSGIGIFDVASFLAVKSNLPVSARCYF